MRKRHRLKGASTLGLGLFMILVLWGILWALLLWLMGVTLVTLVEDAASPPSPRLEFKDTSRNRRPPDYEWSC